MATKKDYLRAAILSGGSMAAIPSNSEIYLGSNLKEGSNPYVAPDNGYIVAAVSGDASKAALRITTSKLEACSHKNSATGEVAASVSLLVKKGDTADIVLTNVTKVYFARFIKLVGGAKSPVAQLFWRVVPCLRTCLTRALKPIADRIRVSSQVAILQLTSRSRQGMRTSMQPLTFLRATACSSSSVSPLKATPTTTSRFDEISSTVGLWGLTGRRGRLSRYPAERVKRFTGTRGLMELLRTSKRTSAFTHTSALNVCFGGASYE